MRAYIAFLLSALLAVSQVSALPAQKSITLPNSYIVVFNPAVDATSAIESINESIRISNSMEQEDGVSARITYQYNIDSFKGFAGILPQRLVDSLKDHPDVQMITEDHIAHAVAEQADAPSWGQVRVGQRNLDLTAPFKYPDHAGSGATAYIIDTGIKVDHPDFGGRAVWGKTTCPGCINDDDNGHGTHVAGTVAGTKHGLAKKAKVVAVKVLNGAGSGTYSGVLAGIDWVASEAKRQNKTVVANMSLGGPKNAALNQAVAAAHKAGVAFAVAAGNEEDDACYTSPASTPEAITVAASDRTDTLAYFSNYGSCVDIIAPGVGITSAWNDGNTNTISGTSMASPHVAGAAALLVAANPQLTPAQIANKLVANATPNKIVSVMGTPNKLLYIN